MLDPVCDVPFEPETKNKPKYRLSWCHAYGTEALVSKIKGRLIGLRRPSESTLVFIMSEGGTCNFPTGCYNITIHGQPVVLDGNKVVVGAKGAKARVGLTIFQLIDLDERRY